MKPVRRSRCGPTLVVFGTESSEKPRAFQPGDDSVSRADSLLTTYKEIAAGARFSKQG